MEENLWVIRLKLIALLFVIVVVSSFFFQYLDSTRYPKPDLVKSHLSSHVELFRMLPKAKRTITVSEPYWNRKTKELEYLCAITLQLGDQEPYTTKGTAYYQKQGSTFVWNRFDSD